MIQIKEMEICYKARLYYTATAELMGTCEQHYKSTMKLSAPCTMSSFCLNVLLMVWSPNALLSVPSLSAGEHPVSRSRLLNLSDSGAEMGVNNARNHL